MALLLAPSPALDATLNSTAAVLLVAGYISIRRKNVLAHKCCMISAFACSCAFLTSYLWYHAHHGDKRFPGQGIARPFYFTLLGTHVVLAGVIVPLVLITLYFALRAQFARHKRVARWTLPIWLYVSVTGVLVYWILYRIY